MPDVNNVSPGYSTHQVDMSKAPGADQDWDSLFLNPEVQTASQPQVASGTNPQQQPQAVTTNQPFIKAGETVYNTAEDAVAGISHKDSVIAKYRDFLSKNGLDPNAVLKDEVQVQRPQAQSQTSQPTNSPYKYYGNPNFFDEVAQAATNKDRVRYEQLMSQHTQEAIQAQLDPWRATLAETNRFRAIRQATAEVPDFGKFIEGPGYKKVMDSFPLYKEMVQIGENDPVAAQRLPEVYKSMYLIYQGMNQQGQPQQAQQTTNVSPQVNPTVRQQPTLQSSALTPPAPVTNTQGWQEATWRGNKPTGNDARKQLIQDGDARFQGMRFEDVSL
jgi:hypothetical protein